MDMINSESSGVAAPAVDPEPVAGNNATVAVSDERNHDGAARGRVAVILRGAAASHGAHRQHARSSSHLQI